jgi:phosphoserine phosphatase
MRWPPYKHVFFDCDSTLTTVEGIDVLAEDSGKGWRVSVLTKAAMDGDIQLEEIYGKRLQALNPTRGDIRAIRQIYKQNVLADVAKTIEALQSAGTEVYIVSGGLEEPVIDFGLYLGVPRDHIRAVPIEYDQLSGKWWQHVDDSNDYDEQFLTHGDNPLIISDGKALIIKEFLKDTSGRSLLIGDGVSDLLASRSVDLFVGFGGVTARDRVVKEAAIYFECQTMAPLLAIALGPAGLLELQKSQYSHLSQKCSDLIVEGVLKFNSEQLEERFDKAWETAYKAFHSRAN